MSLARSFHSDPHGMIFIHASCDQPLMNSPITKLLKFCHSESKIDARRGQSQPCVRNLIIRGFRDPLTILAYRSLHGANFACATCNQLLQVLSN